MPPSTRARTVFGSERQAVAPAKGGAGRHLQLGGSLLDRKPVAQGFGLREPLALIAQSRQRRAGQRVETALASAAFVTLQAMRVAVSDHTRALAMRANPSHPIFDHANRCRSAFHCRQLPHQRLALRMRELHHLGQQMLHVPLSHLPSRLVNQHEPSLTAFGLTT